MAGVQAGTMGPYSVWERYGEANEKEENDDEEENFVGFSLGLGRQAERRRDSSPGRPRETACPAPPEPGSLPSLACSPCGSL